MDEAYIGDIFPISFNSAPRGWAFCNGQLLPIAQNQALYSLLGTTYGGDGRTTFGLPDLRSRIPVGTGQLSGGGNYSLGQTGGTEAVSLNASQLPGHTHLVTGTLQTASLADPNTPKGNFLGADANAQFGTGPATTTMGTAVQGTSGATGASQAHENRQPVLGINYVIATTGLYPSRN